MITWIKGRNSCGKTIKIQEMLGAMIEKTYPDSPVCTITLPEHIIIRFKSSNIYIFINKEKYFKKEYNRIYRLYNRFLSQSKLIGEQENRIKEIKDKIKRIKDTNNRIRRDYEERIQKLQSLIIEEEKLNIEQNTIETYPIFNMYTRLIDVWAKERNINENIPGWRLQSWKELKKYEDDNEPVLNGLKNRWNDIMSQKRIKFMSRNFKNELEIEKNNTPESYSTYRDEWALGSLEKHLERTKRKQINESEILSLIISYPAGKTVWIDGKPSSDFSDFYNLIMKVKDLSPNKVFISHCGNETWFKALPHTLYTLFSGKKTTLDLDHVFNSIYIEVPSMDEIVTVVGENS